MKPATSARGPRSPPKPLGSTPAHGARRHSSEVNIACDTNADVRLLDSTRVLGHFSQPLTYDVKQTPTKSRFHVAIVEDLTHASEYRLAWTLSRCLYYLIYLMTIFVVDLLTVHLLRDLVTRHEASFNPNANEPLRTPPAPTITQHRQDSNHVVQLGDGQSAAADGITTTQTCDQNMSARPPLTPTHLSPNIAVNPSTSKSPDHSRDLPCSGHNSSNPQADPESVSPASVILPRLQEQRHSSSHGKSRPHFHPPLASQSPIPTVENAINEAFSEDGLLGLGQMSSGENLSAHSQQNLAYMTSWQTPEIMWKDSSAYIGDTGQTQSETPKQAQNHQVDFFDNIDILSMIPNDGLDFDADFSTYLAQTGYSPETRVEFPAAVQAGLSGHQDNGISNNKVTSPPPDTGRSSELEQGTFVRMPSVAKETPRKIPIPGMDMDTHQSFLANLRGLLGPMGLVAAELPSLRDMQRFLTSYFTCFHRHCPIIHIQTFDLKSAPRHLVLAMCAIGALYRLSRRTAKDLWSWGNIIADKVSYTKLYLTSPIELTPTRRRLTSPLMCCLVAMQNQSRVRCC